jgi:2-desacetyl-2-hydroxyethyl bacteriochlorophyllide A dehydrogenase
MSNHVWGVNNYHTFKSYYILKSIILNQPFNFELVEKPFIDDYSADEAIVKIKRIGICGTDYHAFSGKQPFFSYPRVLGHELGAEIVALGSNNSENLKIGDKVSIEPYINCGVCDACNRGIINACENINVLGVHRDGGMTEMLKLPIHKIHKSDILSFDQLALVETLGIGYHAVERVNITHQDRVLIVGAGPIGLSAAQFAKQKGAEIYMADIHENRLDFVLKNKLAHHKIVVNNMLEEGYIREIMNGLLPTIILDATGNSKSMNNAFNLIAHGGKIAFLGLFQGEVTFNDPNFHKKEVTLFASRNSMPNDFKTIIKMMESGLIDTTPWISHRTSFEYLPQVFPEWLASHQEVIKGMVEMN